LFFLEERKDEEGGFLFFRPRAQCIFCSLWQVAGTKLLHPLHVQVKGRGKKRLRSWLCLPEKWWLSVHRAVMSYWVYRNHRNAESQNGLVVTFKDYLLHPPAMGRDIFH